MSKVLGDELNDDLWQRLKGENLKSRAEKVILITTVDERGRPHPAMLSYFEVVAADRKNIRMGTYKESSTTENMRCNGKATLSVIDERIAYYIKGSVLEQKRGMASAAHSSKLNLKVEAVLADEANEEFEPGAYVASGITYHSDNRNEQLLKAKEVIRELLLDEG